MEKPYEYLPDLEDDDSCDDGRDEEYDPLESEFDNCHCGAYCFSKQTGKIIKISDCIC